MSERIKFRRWTAIGTRISRESISGDLPGAEDEFGCLTEGVADHLAEYLNQLEEDKVELMAALESLIWGASTDKEALARFVARLKSAAGIGR